MARERKASAAARDLQRIRAEVLLSMEGAVQDGLRLVEDAARQELTTKGHVKTGRLRESIATQTRRIGETAVEGTVGSDVPYAPEIEALGDGGYLRPAFAREGTRVTEVVGQRLEESMRRGAR